MPKSAQKEDQTVTRKAKALVNVIHEMRDIAPKATMNTLLCFIGVAIKPGVTVGDVQRMIGLEPTATARSLAILFKRVRGEPGFDLIEQKPDDRDARVKHLHLSPKGNRVWEKMKGHL